MLKKIKNTLKKSENLITGWHLLQQFYYKIFFTDEEFIRKKFKSRLGRDVNLKNPKKFNDKLQWLKLNWYDPLAVQCADKYAVREFIKEKIGEEYLNELYDIYNSVDEINISKLPEQFVLKGTHGSGFNIICKDKNKMNWKKQKKKMKRWLKKNYYWRTREWVYKDIKPRIVAEKYLEIKENVNIKDYRVFCFNGNPKFITVDFDIIDKKNTKRNLYDLNWNQINGNISYPNKNIYLNKPNNLEKMINLSKILSKPFPHSRIDFYEYKNKLIFGEITFFHQSGMGNIKPKEFEIKMGDWLDLSQINEDGVYEYE